MSDDYPIEKYREAVLTLMHVYIYESTIEDHRAIFRAITILNGLIPAEEKT